MSVCPVIFYDRLRLRHRVSPLHLVSIRGYRHRSPPRPCSSLLGHQFLFLLHRPTSRRLIFSACPASPLFFLCLRSSGSCRLTEPLLPLHHHRAALVSSSTSAPLSFRQTACLPHITSAHMRVCRRHPPPLRRWPPYPPPNHQQPPSPTQRDPFDADPWTLFLDVTHTID